MTRHRCESCLGEYDDVSADGVPYFHVCPPVTMVKAELPDGTIEERPLRGFAGFTIAESADAKRELVKNGGDAEAIVIDKGRREAPRAEARDERTARYDESGSKKTRVIKSEGKGRTAIPALVAPDAVDDAV